MRRWGRYIRDFQDNIGRKNDRLPILRVSLYQVAHVVFILVHLERYPIPHISLNSSVGISHKTPAFVLADNFVSIVQNRSEHL